MKTGKMNLQMRFLERRKNVVPCQKQCLRGVSRSGAFGSFWTFIVFVHAIPSTQHFRLAHRLG